jgi:gliding motility-associated-like protein
VVPAFRPAWVPVACVEDRQAPLTVRFTDAAGNAATRWDFGDGSPLVDGADVQHTYRDAGHYQPRVSLRYLNAQCETTTALAAIEVQNQQIPNVITPNGDAANQTFRLPPNCAPHIELYSRWGKRVFEAAAYQNNWDAHDQGAGLYYYLLTYPDGHRVKGWLEVLK